jgi:hypothetical protein
MGAKWLGCETAEAFLSDAKVKNVWSCITAPIHLYGLCLIKQSGIGTFLLYEFTFIEGFPDVPQ